MRYLLDTHTLIWYLEDSKSLPKRLKDIIDNPNNSVFVSIVSLWEIVIKQNIGRLNLSITVDELFDIIQDKDYVLLPIKQEYLKIYRDLYLHHHCPFDRLLIATAISENLKFITKDKEIRKYYIDWIW